MHLKYCLQRFVSSIVKQFDNENMKKYEKTIEKHSRVRYFSKIAEIFRTAKKGQFCPDS